MLLMGKAFLNFKIVVLIICGVVLVVSLIVIFRKPLGRVLRIRPRVLGVVAATIVLLFFGDLSYKQQFESMNILPRTWENEAVNVEYNGLIVNLIHNLKTFSEIQMDGPEGYAQEMAERYGDHLPPVEEFEDLGLVNEKYGKYSTSLVMYSNYKSISTGTEYITPNQLAAQIMVDSGIEHSSYYDYIYFIRDSYPVLHKEFVQVEGNPELDDYYFLPYDLLAGKKYLFEKE